MELENDITKWWPKLSESMRTEIAKDPHGPLPTGAVVALTQARGYGPPLVGFVGDTSMPGHVFLKDEEQDWIEVHGA